ncbi:hypothetical protein T12_2532 [Trichinella patagoniensis]|uniref:Uncharacterized protein n=1 Tax=Trichinella patagoniensis TaxID=990121 RepID=A0A0V1A509_9BILA|nr:hypothetical protein T12_2532 [Trichinella patagoniensis]
MLHAVCLGGIFMDSHLLSMVVEECTLIEQFSQ